MNTSGPNPWFWAQNDRFGPDVVTFGVNFSQKNQEKMTQNNQKWPHLAQTQVLMHILRVLGDPKNASKILPCRGDSLLERVRVLERSWDGVREGPGEKRRSDDARALGVGGIGATPCKGKPLRGTGSALGHGGVAGFKGWRRCRPRKGAAAAQGQVQVSAQGFWMSLRVGAILKLMELER